MVILSLLGRQPLFFYGHLPSAPYTPSSLLYGIGDLFVCGSGLYLNLCANGRYGLTLMGGIF